MLNITAPDGARIFEFFEEISSIPHGSGNTKLIADYLVSFAKVRGLEALRDSHDNVIIKKKASEGYSSRPTVILQGHLDMVAEKKANSDVDMTKDALKLYIDGDFIRAEDTTLGGDDGVAIAYILALLDGSYPHPAIEAVFTADEEIGLIGAKALDASSLEGKMLINIDSDEEGIFTVGCAGGVRCDTVMTVEREAFCGEVFKASVSGFKGGHSGVEIDKGRANAIKALGKALLALGDIRIIDVSGGNADNAIPRAAECLFASENDALSLLAKVRSELIAEYGSIEPDMEFSLEKASDEKAAMPLSRKDTERVIGLISDTPTGVIAMSRDIEGLVETSLNLGIIRLDDAFRLTASVRSSLESEKKKLRDRLKAISLQYSADYSERGEYPAWEYKPSSYLCDTMVSVYEKMYNKKPVVQTIHAGLECGIFTEKIEGLECVSIGPDNFDIHTTEEHLSISSTVRVWEYLLEVLKNI